MKKQLLLFFLWFVTVTSLVAQTSTPPSVGDGTSGNPYEIATFENLYWLSKNDGEWTKYYIQTADINASESYTMSNGLNTIGDDGDDFTGSYDGQGFTIDSIYINRSSGIDKAYQYIGLFGRTNGATFENITLTNCNITGYKYVGSLVGYDYVGSTISNCKVLNAIVEAINDGTNQDNVGGLIGYAKETAITNCSTSNAKVKGDDYVGGLAGYGYKAQFSNCYALNANVTAADDYVGGFAGYVRYSEGTIDNCYSTGTVTGNASVGGLVGYDNASGGITNCYSSATVTGDGDSDEKEVGGLVGESKGTITNCYSVGAVSSVGTDVGPFLGYNNGATVSNCYYNSETTEISDNGFATAKTTAELKQQATFSGWDFGSIWEISEGVTYPGFQNLTDPIVLAQVDDIVIKVNENYTKTIELISQDLNEATISYALVQKPDGMTLTDNTIEWVPTEVGSYVVYFQASYPNDMSSSGSYIISVTSLNGEGTEASPYEIASLDDLNELSQMPSLWEFDYIQTANIDATITNTWNEDDHDGDSSTDSVAMGFSPIGDESTMFTGSFNGQGNTINNLFINRPVADYVGLFGLVEGSTIENLALTNCVVTGNTNVGILVGRINESTTSNVYISGSVNGYSRVGGLAGKTFAGSIENSYATAAVFGEDIVGGLVGENKVDLLNCYATGSVSSYNDRGGLVATHSSTYTITNCYYNIESSAQSDTVTVLGVAKSTAEMQQDVTFTAWDFVSTWEITNGETFPRLQSLNDAPVILHNTVTLGKVNVELVDAIGIIAMDNQTVSVELLQKPEGMTITDGVLTWTPTQSSADTIIIKASDANGLYATYTYVLTIISINGEGTETSPFEIPSVDDLKQLSEVPSIWDKYFIQTADIDASSLSGYSPIGNSSTNFTGSYNAKGYTISNLSISLFSSDYVGLFGYVNNASIDSLVLTNCTVLGGNYAGTLAGYSISTDISNCYATGKVTGTENLGGLIGLSEASSKINTCSTDVLVLGSENLGGLVGYNSAAITDCYTVGDIKGSSYIGGLAGYNTDTIKNCYSTGSILGGADYLGGLVGYSYYGSYITACYSTADVTGDDEISLYLGGLVGNVVGSSITNSYATGSVYGYNYVGGFLGSADYDISNTTLPSVENCYSIGMVTGFKTVSPKIGGFDGYFDYRTSAVSCYFDSVTTTQLTSNDGIGKTTAEMKMEATFVGWDFDAAWTVNDSIYPALNTISNNAPFAFGDSVGVAGVSYVFANDFDFETGQEKLTCKLLSGATRGTFANGYYSFTEGAIAGTLDTLTYRIGEVVAVGDTLWGNIVEERFTKIVNTAPVITAVSDLTIDEHTNCTLSLSDITASDVNGDSLFIVISAGDNYTVDGNTVLPIFGFYGELTVQISVFDGELYSNTMNMTITVIPVPDETVLTWETPATATYGAAIGTAVMNAQASGEGTLSYDFAADSIFNVGTYVLRTEFTPANSNDFTMVSTTVNYTVEKAELIATADDHTITLDAAIPELTISYTGFANDETESVLDVLPTATTTATQSSPVGEYVVSVSGGSDANYNITYVEGTITITEKAIPELTWETPASIVYGTAIGTSVMNAQSTVDGTFAYNFTADSIFDAGTFQLQVEFTPTDNIAYSSNQTTVSYTVTKAPLTATADDITIKEGSAVPELTISYSGLVNGEVVSVLDALPIASTTADATSAVGDYPITVADGLDNNYEFIYVEGTLTITNKIIPEITWEITPSTIYGTTIGTSVMNAQSTVDGIFTYSFVADSIFNVGSYLLQADFTPSNTVDYASITTTVEYSVTKAPLTVTAASFTIIVGDDIPELSFSYSGFVNDEAVSELNVVPTVSTSANSASLAGVYDIIVSGGSDNNYEFVYVNGTLTINEVPALSVSVTELAIEPADNSTVTFDIISNINWTVTSSDSWLTASAASGAEDATITLTAEANTTDVDRVATITVSGEGVDAQTITVSQPYFVGVSNENMLDIMVYPNPANSIIYVANVANAFVKIFDTKGAVIFAKSMVSEIEQINVSNFNIGIYIINITNNEGTVSKRLVIE